MSKSRSKTKDANDAKTTDANDASAQGGQYDFTTNGLLDNSMAQAQLRGHAGLADLTPENAGGALDAFFTELQTLDGSLGRAMAYMTVTSLRIGDGDASAIEEGRKVQAEMLDYESRRPALRESRLEQILSVAPELEGSLKVKVGREYLDGFADREADARASLQNMTFQHYDGEFFSGEGPVEVSLDGFISQRAGELTNRMGPVLAMVPRMQEFGRSNQRYSGYLSDDDESRVKAFMTTTDAFHGYERRWLLAVAEGAGANQSLVQRILYGDGLFAPSGGIYDELLDEEEGWKSAESRVRDFGEMDDVQSDLPRVAGGLLDMLMPEPGDKGKLQANVNIPVYGGSVGSSRVLKATAMITVGGEFVMEGERGDNKEVKLRTQLGFVVMGEASASVFGEKVASTVAKLNIGGYVESQGDSGAEAVELMLLSIRKRIEAIEGLADAVMDGDRQDAVERGMDADDYFESGAYGSASSELEASSENQDYGVSGTLTGTTGTKYVREGNKMRAIDAKSIQASIGMSVGPFAGEIKATHKLEDGKRVEKEVEFAAKASLDLEKVLGKLVKTDFATSVLTKAGGAIKGLAGGRFASLGSALVSKGAPAFAKIGLTKKNLSPLAKVWQQTLQLVLKVKSAGESKTGSLALERVGSASYGDPTDPVYLLLERTNRLAYTKFRV